MGKLEDEIYNFFVDKTREYPELHYLQVGGAIQSACLRLIDKMEREIETKRAEEWVKERSKKGE